MNTVDSIMALADRYAFHIPGSQHSDEARAALHAALQEQAPKRLWGMAGFNPPLPNVGEKYTSIHEDDLGDHVTVTGIANASSPNIAYVFLSWDDGHYGERAIDEFWQEYMMVQTNDQAREGEAVANSAILARGRFHAFKGEDGEPDDWEWFEEGTNCEHAGELLQRSQHFIETTLDLAKPNCTECAKWAKEQADNREWIAGVKKGRKMVDRMVDAVIGKTITKIKKPLPLPPESLFELWWAEYLPEATQARAFEAWSRVDAAPQPAQPSDIGIPITQPEQGPST